MKNTSFGIKLLGLLALASISIFANGQIKVYTNGRVHIGDLIASEPEYGLRINQNVEFLSPNGEHSNFLSDPNGVSYLVKAGDRNRGLRLHGNGDVHFYSQNFGDYGTLTVTKANQKLSKCWVVEDFVTGNTNFCVMGDGSVFSKGNLLKNAIRSNQNDPAVGDALVIVKELGSVRSTGANGASLGVNVDDLKRVLPEVVKTLPEGDYIDYDMIVPVLLEAIKAQQNQIKLLASKLGVSLTK